MSFFRWMTAHVHDVFSKTKSVEWFLDMHSDGVQINEKVMGHIETYLYTSTYRSEGYLSDKEALPLIKVLMMNDRRLSPDVKSTYYRVVKELETIDMKQK